MKHWDLPEDWEIEAALPEYVDGEGDATRLFLADGTDRLVRARLRTVLYGVKNRKSPQATTLGGFLHVDTVSLYRSCHI